MNRSVCPDCGGGWTFDFGARRVYCRTCESAKGGLRVDPVGGVGQGGVNATGETVLSSSSALPAAPETPARGT